MPFRAALQGVERVGAVDVAMAEQGDVHRSFLRGWATTECRGGREVPASRAAFSEP
jgi:hypothetical protein